MKPVNNRLLPVKAHYFFFMAAMGPILPFLPVIGKQLGVSEVQMGLIMSVTPVFFVIAKPVFGFILDYFQSLRKTLFMLLLVSTTVIFAFLQFVPVNTVKFQQMTCNDSLPNCLNEVDISEEARHSEGVIIGAFVILMTAGNIGYNVANSVSDAVCFDVLGSGKENKYGQQRVWGTLGFGLSALLGGYCVDWWSTSDKVKNYSPAFLLAILFTSVDLLCCFKLKMPQLPKSQNILKDVTNLVRNPSISTFLLFAAFIGICESYIIYFMFWYLEDLAMANGMMQHIKLLQGLTVAAETLVGELIIFPLSGRILNAVGYRNCLSLCFLVYALRLGLFSLISNPWWAVGIDMLQGPSYALSYTTIVAYASAISPPGTSATVQGIAAGVDDGFGFSVGSLVGGLLYRSLGGKVTFRVFSVFALVCSITHWLVYLMCFQEQTHSVPSHSLQNQETHAIYKPPKEAVELVEVAS